MYNMDGSNCTYLNFGQATLGQRKDLNVTVKNESDAPIYLKIDENIDLINGLTVRMRYQNATLFNPFTKLEPNDSIQVWILVTALSYAMAGNYTFTISFIGCSTPLG